MAAVLAMALSMRVVAEATSVLEAFLNYVALAFLTEVDNLVMNSRVIRRFLRALGKEQTDTKVVLRRACADREAPLHWVPDGKLCPVLYGCMNAGMFLGVCIDLLLVTSVAAARDPPPEIDWRSGLLGGITLVIASNVLIAVSGHLCGGSFMPSYLFALACLVFMLLFPHVGVPFARAVAFMFALFGTSAVAAAQPNQFVVIVCPVRIPLMVWMAMIVGADWTKRLQQDGVT